MNHDIFWHVIDMDNNHYYLFIYYYYIDVGVCQFLLDHKAHPSLFLFSFQSCKMLIISYDLDS